MILCQIVRPKCVFVAVLKTVFITPKTIPALPVTFRLVTAQLVPVARPVATPLKQEAKR